MILNGEEFKIEGIFIYFKMKYLFSNTTDEKYFINDASDIKDWNDIIVGEVLEIGKDAKNVKVGEHIGVQLSMCLSITDLMECDELSEGNENGFVIPENLITIHNIIEENEEDVE